MVVARNIHHYRGSMKHCGFLGTGVWVLVVMAIGIGSDRVAARLPPTDATTQKATPPPAKTPPSTIEVVASATGETREQALRAAQTGAVEQALGRIVDVDTLVENNAVIRDQILSATNGFIERFTVLTEGKKDGLFRIQIRATVRSGKISERLAAVTKSSAKVAGGDLEAEARTKAKSREDQVRMFQTTIATVLDGVVGVRQASKFEIVQGSNVPAGFTRLRIPIELFVDQQVWDDKMKRLIPQLEEFAKVKRTRPIRMTPAGRATEQINKDLSLCCADSDGLDSQHTFPPVGCLAPLSQMYAQGERQIEQVSDACSRECVIEASKKAKEDLHHFMVIHNAKPAGGTAELAVYVLPREFINGIWSDYHGNLIVRAILLDSSAKQVTSSGAVYTLCRSSANTKLPQNGAFGCSNGPFVSGFGSTLLAGGFLKSAHAILCPGILYQFLHMRGTTDSFIMANAFYGNLYVEVETASLGRVASVECQVEIEHD